MRAARRSDAVPPAGLVRRQVAWLIDRLIGLAAWSLSAMWLVLGVWGLRGLPRDWAEALVLVAAVVGLGLALHVLYQVAFVGGCGQTPGQMALGVAVVRDDGAPAGYGRAALRSIGGLGLAILTLGLASLASLFLMERRGVADWLAGTRVVRLERREEPGPASEGGRR
jgi:uncharacterized RDD family membrane protein YckC